MYFDELAPEIILLIATHLTDAALNALTKTNHHFCNLLQPCLYQRNAKEVCTALFWAATHDVPSTARLMLTAGANVNKALTPSQGLEYQEQLQTYGVLDTYKGEPPLHTASAHGSLQTMQLLLDYGANLEQRDWLGNTTLFTCNPTNLDALTLLCDNGARVTPDILEHIARLGNESTMHFFLEWFAYSPAELVQMRLMGIAAQYGNISTAQALAKHGVSTRVNRQGYSSPPLIAIEYHQEKMLEFLLENGGGVDDVETSTLDSSILHCALEQQLYSTIPLLVRFGADINSNPSRFGFTPLIYASRLADLEAMKWLFANGAEVDARDDMGQTALFDATWLGNDEVVKELLRRGARVDARDNEGRTAIDFAKEFDMGHILEIFRDWKAAAEEGLPQ